MKLFIWTEFCPDWSDGLAFAIAKDEAEAKKLVTKEFGLNPWHWGKLEVRQLDLPVAKAISGGA